MVSHSRCSCGGGAPESGEAGPVAGGGQEAVTSWRELQLGGKDGGHEGGQADGQEDRQADRQEDRQEDGGAPGSEWTSTGLLPSESQEEESSSLRYLGVKSTWSRLVI